MPGWEANLVGRWLRWWTGRGLFFIMDIAPATPTFHHFGILAGVSDKCDPASSIRSGARVTMSTVATLPGCERRL